MLHLSGWIAFGVDVGNLFELQRAFESYWKVDTTAEKQEVFGVV